MQQQLDAARGILSDAFPQQTVKEGVGVEEEERRDIWEICWIFITPSLQTCVRDGEGAGAAGSRPDRECRPGGEIVDWEEGDPGFRVRIHPFAQPAEVRFSLIFPLRGSPGGDF